MILSYGPPISSLKPFSVGTSDSRLSWLLLVDPASTDWDLFVSECSFDSFFVCKKPSGVLDYLASLVGLASFGFKSSIETLIGLYAEAGVFWITDLGSSEYCGSTAPEASVNICWIRWSSVD